MWNYQANLAILSVSAVGFFGTISPADAGGFLNTLQSAASAAAAGAGATALGEDAATVWYNPAGMVLSDRPEALVSGGLNFPSVSFQNSGSTDAIGLPIGGNSLTNPTDVLLPSIFASTPIAERLHVGLGVFVPFGQASKYDDNWIGRYQVQHVLLKTIDVRPAVAYRINDVLSVGGALDVQYAKFQAANALDFGALCFATAACLAGPEGADGRLVTNLSTWGVGYDFGVLIEAGGKRVFSVCVAVGCICARKRPLGRVTKICLFDGNAGRC